MGGRTLTVLAEGFAFPEGPRWHDGSLWFSDMFGLAVVRVDPSGSSEEIVDVPGQPSGLGWLPDGRMLVVSMEDRKVLRLDPDGLVEHADLSAVATASCNDMVVDRLGRAYVGNFGGDLRRGVPPAPASLALAYADGRVTAVADDLCFANGMAICPDGQTLFVAESMSVPPRISAFDICSEGQLTNRRVVAEFETEAPDGICLDAEGAVWIASPNTKEAARVLDGRVVERISTGEHGCYAVALGGPSGCTLFVCTSGTSLAERARRRRTGRISVVEVDVPAA
jgi:sugar lactone lactonase YvrE